MGREVSVPRFQAQQSQPEQIFSECRKNAEMGNRPTAVSPGEPGPPGSGLPA